MIITDFFESYSNNNKIYAYRWKKVRANGLYFMGKDNILWSLTQQYLKIVEREIANKYDDWEALTPEMPELYALVTAVNEKQKMVKFQDKNILVIYDNPAEPPELETIDPNTVRSIVTTEAITSAGQVAEALGKAIQGYLAHNMSAQADKALTELLWISKNVSWEIKANRHHYESKWGKQP